MTQLRDRLILLVTSLWLVAAPAIATPLTYSFETIPTNGIVAGAPGDVLGWGYQIENKDPVNWLVVTGLTAGSFLHGTPDASVFDFPILAPGLALSVPFDANAGTGLYKLTWDANAPLGFTNTGAFTIAAEWWSDDPFLGGAFIQTADIEVQSYSVAVSNTTSVPEPATVVLTGLGGLILRRSMHKSRRD